MNIENTLNKFFFVILAILCLIAIAISVHMNRVKPFSEKKLLFVPEAKYLERIIGTFRNPVALAFYMKGAQELAYNTKEKFDLLIALFRLTIDLDPKITQAAFLGGMVAPERAKNIPKAIELLKEAAEKNPKNWRIYYWTGFNYLQIGSYKKAAEYYKKASELPGALPFLETASVHILARGNDLGPAIAEAERILAANKEDEDTAELMELRLLWLKSMKFLEQKTIEFHNKTGRYPQRLEELVEHNILPKLPQDEFGGGFYLVHPGDEKLGYMVRSDF
jgi:tetratricopeptide (TPR) repeat protein